MQRRGLLIQTLPKPPKSILQDKLEECGESGGGYVRGGGETEWEMGVRRARFRF